MIVFIFVFFVVGTIQVHCMVTFMSQKRPQRLITKRIGNRIRNSRDQKIVLSRYKNFGHWVDTVEDFIYSINFRRMQIAAV